jgi:hypothetical protein
MAERWNIGLEISHFRLKIQFEICNLRFEMQYFIIPVFQYF